MWAQRGETETRLLGNGSPMSCDGDSVCGGELRLTDDTIKVLLLFCLMRKSSSIARVAWGHADVICLSDTKTGNSTVEWMNARNLLVESSSPTMRLVKEPIMGKGVH